MKRHIPNLITLLNLLSGSISIVFALHGDLAMASWMIGLAALFDFLDGMAARLLNAKSKIGNILDSLGDMISFGLAPAMILYMLLGSAPDMPDIIAGQYHIPAFIAFLVPVFSAIRLAKFSVDDQQQDHFLGLPTPANALFFASIPLILIQYPDGSVIHEFFQGYYTLVALIVLTSILMVSNVPLFSLKFKNFEWKSNQYRYIFLMLAIALLIFFHFLAIPVLILFYIGFSLLIPLK